MSCVSCSRSDHEPDGPITCFRLQGPWSAAIPPRKFSKKVKPVVYLRPAGEFGEHALAWRMLLPSACSR